MIKESNGITDASGADAKKGMVAYNFAPGAWRNPAGGTKKTFAEVMTQAGTGRAAARDLPGRRHARDRNRDQGLAGRRRVLQLRPVPDRVRRPRGRSRRSGSPTLDGAGVTPADLATVESRTAKCIALGGVYGRATMTTTTTQASALAEGLTKPIEERLLNAATASNTTLTSQVTALTNEVNTLKAQVSGMQAAATPIKLTVASAKAKTVASKGADVTVNAQAQKAVKVTVSLTEAQARKLKLGSSRAGLQDGHDRRRRQGAPRP